MPQGNYTKYDLVIEREGKFYRIQCKHAHLNEDESFTVSTWYNIRSTSTKQRYTSNDCDYFMTEFNNQYYMFPIFGTTETKFWLSDGHSTSSKLAKDYLAEKILNQL